MRYYIVTMLLWVGTVQAFAQQPRLKQVDEYLAATGQPVEVGKPLEKEYCLLSTLYKRDKSLMLNLPNLEDYGTREVIPFGFKLNQTSELELARQEGNKAESTVRSFYSQSMFSGVSYQFCDSVVYGITLYYDDQEGVKQNIHKNLLKHFKQADYMQGEATIYSDPDYAVKVLPGKVEFYSLFHFPTVETFYPGVSHKIWYGPYNYEVDGASVMLAFYNQESKENNIQSAFKVSYKYPVGKPFKMNLIRFILDDETIELPLEVEYTDVVDGGKSIEERDTRTFLFPEVLKAMDRSAEVGVELVGEGGRFLYKMPAFQRASVHTTYEYFRWNVTNPMAKYRAW